MFAILFDSQSIVKPATFAAEIAPPAIHAPLVPGRKGFTTLDAAFESGRTAALESGFEDVRPPAGYSAAEAEAFNAGATEGYRELEWERELACRATVTTWEELDAIEGHGGFLGHDA